MPSIVQKPRAARLRHSRSPANPLYGYNYRPDWPSILSIAHDEENGARLFLITDRPCALWFSSPPDLPLQVAGLRIYEAVQILPVKFRLWMDYAVPQGAAWHWLGGSSTIHDTALNGLNAAQGVCADIAGPYIPYPGALVVSAQAMGNSAILEFDRPVPLVESPVVDDAIVFDGTQPTYVNQLSPYALEFGTNTYVQSGSTWTVARQPDWIRAPVENPASGVF